MAPLLQSTELMAEYYTLSAAEKPIARTAVGIQILDAIPGLDYTTDVDATNFLGDGVTRNPHHLDTLSTANTAEVVFNANVSSAAVETGLAELQTNANLSIAINGKAFVCETSTSSTSTDLIDPKPSAEPLATISELEAKLNEKRAALQVLQREKSADGAVSAGSANTVGSVSTAAYASVAINVRGDLLAMSAEDISASSGCSMWLALLLLAT